MYYRYKTIIIDKTIMINTFVESISMNILSVVGFV